MTKADRQRAFLRTHRRWNKAHNFTGRGCPPPSNDQAQAEPSNGFMLRH